MAYSHAAMELALRPLRADGSYRTKGRSDTGEDGTFDAWHQIHLQLDVVEACAAELDPGACARVVALRGQLDARRGLPSHGSAGGLNEIVHEVQDVVRHLREIIVVKGAAALSAPANDLTQGWDVVRTEVADRRPALVEMDEKLFRVSNSMWDVLRSVE